MLSLDVSFINTVKTVDGINDILGVLKAYDETVQTIVINDGNAVIIPLDDSKTGEINIALWKTLDKACYNRIAVLLVDDYATVKSGVVSTFNTILNMALHNTSTITMLMEALTTRIFKNEVSSLNKIQKIS